MTRNPNPGCSRCQDFFRLLDEESRRDGFLRELPEESSEWDSVKPEWAGSFRGSWSLNGQKEGKDE